MNYEELSEVELQIELARLARELDNSTRNNKIGTIAVLLSAEINLVSAYLNKAILIRQVTKSDR